MKKKQEIKKVIPYIIVVLLIVVISSITSVNVIEDNRKETVVETLKSNVSTYESHLIKSGETLYSIAEDIKTSSNLNVTIEEVSDFIANLNGIDEEANLTQGRFLLIPVYK